MTLPQELLLPQQYDAAYGAALLTVVVRRIDGMVALVMALGAASKHVGEAVVDISDLINPIRLNYR